jgi:iduronate 2-sulfatase
VELLDLYPTLADLCELVPPENVEGTSLVPILDDAQAMVKDAALTQHPRPAYAAKGQAPEVMGYSIRSDRFRYTEWRRVNGSEIVAQELYDHATDPRETVNLADSGEATNVLARHAMMLARMVDSEQQNQQTTTRK